MMRPMMRLVLDLRHSSGFWRPSPSASRHM